MLKNLNIKSILKTSLFVTVVFAGFSSCDTDETQTVITKTNLVFEDNFSTDGAIDTNTWNVEIGKGPNNDGWGNNELQYYTARPENIKVEGGMLKITALKENYMSSAYTSARITTKGKVSKQYGRMEARMKLPTGKGMWPAFWMMGSNIDSQPWPQCGEIDIMENKGSQPSTVSGALHGPGYSGGTAKYKSYNFTNSRVDTEFHVYGVEWDQNYVNFYVDNVLYNQYTPESVSGKEWVFNNSPFFMLMNLAVGGNFDGAPLPTTVFPQTMLVDYVRIYQ